VGNKTVNKPFKGTEDQIEADDKTLKIWELVHSNLESIHLSKLLLAKECHGDFVKTDICSQL
jgi:hypothetical protein